MSQQPVYVVLPVQPGGAENTEHNPEQLASVIQQTLHQQSQTGNSVGQQGQRGLQGLQGQRGQHSQEQTGPLKEIIAHQDSLYKYISWEEPIRTIGSYIAALSILLGAHYLPLTQLALKGGATALGVITVTEFASRSFGPDTFLARLRPKQYKKVPEPLLNATLKDIHDLVQYLAVQAQRILFGQDLGKAAGAFFGLTAVYWLIKIISPFWLLVVGLTSVYVAPLIILLRNSGVARDVARDVSARSSELANAATEKGIALAKDGKAMASNLASTANDKASEAGRSIGNAASNAKQTAGDLTNRASDATTSLAQNARQTAGDLSNRASDGASNLADSARQTAGNVSNKASDVSNRASDGAANLAQNARQTAGDVSNRASDGASNLAYNARQTAGDVSNRASDGASNISGGLANNARKLQGSDNHATGNYANGNTHHPNTTSAQYADTTYSTPGHATSQRTTYAVDPISAHPVAGVTYDSQGRPRAAFPAQDRI